MHAKKTNKTKLAVILLALALLIGGAVGGTLAWLIDTTPEITNTFTVGDINITLTEPDAPENKEFKMVPGSDIEKKPTVTVVGGSEACWLFVKVEESANFDTFMEYDMADGWTALDATNHPGVYYREVATSTDDQPFSVLAGDKVHVLDTVTKTMMETAKTTAPTLTFTAYAIQSANIADASAAWTAVNAPST